MLCWQEVGNFVEDFLLQPEEPEIVSKNVKITTKPVKVRTMNVKIINNNREQHDLGPAPDKLAIGKEGNNHNKGPSSNVEEESNGAKKGSFYVKTSFLS